MKAELETVETIKLYLTINEAHWLKMVMQNPLHRTTQSCEGLFDKDMRENLWNALSNLGISI